MLIRFVVSNFLSFKEETEFNMLAGTEQKHHKDHIYRRNSVDLLKTAALYGANGAGKSNLIKAISLLKGIITTGGKESLMLVKSYKLETIYSSLPTSFEIEFIKNDIIFLYGLVIYENEVLEEWLYKSGIAETEDDVLFHRRFIDGHTEIKFSDDYTKTEKDNIQLDFVKNNLVNIDEIVFKVLSDLKEGFKEIKYAFEWFKDNLAILFPDTKAKSLVELLMSSDSFKQFANAVLCSFNTGISSVNIRTFLVEEFFEKNNIYIPLENIKENIKKRGTVRYKSSNGIEEVIAVMENNLPVVKRLVNQHRNIKGDSVDFFLDEESDGTIRLLDFIPAIYLFMDSDIVVLIDEIDQSIHPVLLKELVSKFVSDKDSKGQLIFTTHEANLLDQSIFRRDEIWFVEKDQGETKLYPLSDFDIRYDLDIRKGYLSGRFGAIPFMGDLQNLNWDQYAEAQ